ncbi:maleylpyruvate isomerase family mycothiol-dependent enzyme [Modestobacter sp. SYSU DS0290]
MQDPDPFVLAAVRRRAVADLIAGLDDAQLATPSLCAGWDVRTVGAHLADAAAPGALGEFARDLVRARGRLHRANDEAARRAGRRPVAETVALLRERADSRFTPPVTGPRAPLTEVLVHEGDMRLPLGLPFAPDPAAVRVALEFVTTGRPVGFVPRGRLRGLRLVATDLDWSAGDGAEVRGRGVDLLLAACGRGAVLPELDGPGRRLLEDRSS